jgi:hypothetical protein
VGGFVQAVNSATYAGLLGNATLVSEEAYSVKNPAEGSSPWGPVSGALRLGNAEIVYYLFLVCLIQLLLLSRPRNLVCSTVAYVLSYNVLGSGAYS